MPQIKVLIADDHAIVRMGLKLLIDSTKDLTLVGEVKNGAEAVSAALRLHPDVIVMDLMMPQKDGVQATAEITELSPDAKVVLLTTYGTSDGIAHAIEAGAVGAVLKSDAETELVPAIRKVAAGKTAISAEIRRQIAANPPIPPLTPRQRDILASITRGHTNADIARELGITEITVKNHISLLFEKLGVSNRSEAAAIALRKQLVKM